MKKRSCKFMDETMGTEIDMLMNDGYSSSILAYGKEVSDTYLSEYKHDLAVKGVCCLLSACLGAGLCLAGFKVKDIVSSKKEEI